LVEERATPLCYTCFAPLSLLSSVCSVEFRSNNTNSSMSVWADSKHLNILNLWLLPNLPNLCSLESIAKLGRVSESQNLPQQYLRLEN